jgi:hypothetical protein
LAQDMMLSEEVNSGNVALRTNHTAFCEPASTPFVASFTDLVSGPTAMAQGEQIVASAALRP